MFIYINMFVYVSEGDPVGRFHRRLHRAEDAGEEGGEGRGGGTSLPWRPLHRHGHREAMEGGPGECHWRVSVSEPVRSGMPLLWSVNHVATS